MIMKVYQTKWHLLIHFKCRKKVCESMRWKILEIIQLNVEMHMTLDPHHKKKMKIMQTHSFFN